MENSHKWIGCLAAISIMFFAACKKKDGVSAKDTVVGRWTLTDVAVDSNNNRVKDANEYGAPFDTTSMVFNSDGTGSSGPFPLWWSMIDDKNFYISIQTNNPRDTTKAQIVSSGEIDVLGTGTVSGNTVTAWFILKKN